MNVKEFLERTLILDRAIESCVEEIDRYRRLAFRTEGGYGTERVSRSAPTEAPFARWVESLVDKERVLNEKIDRLVEAKLEISNFIDKVEDLEWQSILRNRYVLCRSWPEVAKAMRCSVSRVKHLHKKILENLKFDTI